MECQICYTKSTPLNTMVLLHGSHHKMCQECHTKLRNNKITRCPFCRERINKDIIETFPNSPSDTYHSQHLYQPIRYIHHIDTQQLIEYGISQKFIETISETLPFSYTSRFEGVDFIVKMKHKYEEWRQHNI